MANGPGRDRKKGLDYYPWIINAYDNDPKLFDLYEEYGPLGDAVYRRCLDMIYANGYYMEMDIQRLARKLISKIGNRWTKGVHQIVCILRFCSELGLFESSLAEQGIWTSSGIQKNYLFVAGRRKIYDTKYLLNKDIPLNAPENSIDVTENTINVAKNTINEVKMTPNKRKENKTKENTKDIAVSRENKEDTKPKKENLCKHKYGEYQHVLLTDKEYQMLSQTYADFDDLIKFLDEYIEMKGYKAKSHYLAIKKWVVDAFDEQQQRQARHNKKQEKEDLVF